MNSKTLNYVFGIIALAALVLAGYFHWQLKHPQVQQVQTEVQSQTQNQPATQDVQTQTANTSEVNPNWQTYTNDKFHFQFSYPKGYDYAVKEECKTYFGQLNCLVTMKNSYSRMVVDVNSPGRGGYNVSKYETGTLNIGGVNITYKYGMIDGMGADPDKNSWALLVQFKNGKDDYYVTYDYTEAHPGVFMDQIMKPVLESFKFTK